MVIYYKNQSHKNPILVWKYIMDGTKGYEYKIEKFGSLVLDFSVNLP